jgi:hypothetical protein
MGTRRKLPLILVAACPGVGCPPRMHPPAAAARTGGWGDRNRDHQHYQPPQTGESTVCRAVESAVAGRQRGIGLRYSKSRTFKVVTSGARCAPDRFRHLVAGMPLAAQVR